MRIVLYSQMVSLDGFIEGPAGELDWAVVDEELHRHFNDLESTVEARLYGRRVYERMAACWRTVENNPSAPKYEVEYAGIRKNKPKIVFSKNLDGILADHSPETVMFDVPPPIQSKGIEANKKAWQVFFSWFQDFGIFNMALFTAPPAAPQTCCASRARGRVLAAPF